MNEQTFWQTRVRPALNVPPLMIAKKVRDAVNRGMPDVDAMLNGRALKLELKYVPKYPARATTPIHIKVTPEQRKWLREFRDAGGCAYVMLGVEDRWYVFDCEVPTELEPAQLELRAIWWGEGKKELADWAIDFATAFKPLEPAYVRKEVSFG